MIVYFNLRGREVWSQRLDVLPRVGDLVKITLSDHGVDPVTFKDFRVKGVIHGIGLDALGENVHQATIELAREGRFAVPNVQESTGYVYDDSLTGETRTDGHDSIFEVVENIESEGDTAGDGDITRMFHVDENGDITHDGRI